MSNEVQSVMSARSNIPFSDMQYIEGFRTVSAEVVDPGHRFSLRGTLLDLNLGESNPSFSFAVGNVEVIADVSDEFDCTRDDVYDCINAEVTFDLMVGSTYELIVTDVRI